MSKPTAERPLQLGDRVRIRHSNGMHCRIVELRGPLGPKGVQIYRVRVKRWPESIEIEVREDQLVLLPAREEQPPTEEPIPE